MKNRLWKFMIPAVVFAVIGVLPNPIPESVHAMRTLAVFAATISFVLVNALPLGAATLFGLLALVILDIKTFAQAFGGYHDPVVWLVWSAFFVASAIIRTGLGVRLSTVLVRLFGRSVISLGYCFSFTDALIAPVIPSVTARSGGIIYPIVRSTLLQLEKTKGTNPRIASFLTMLSFQSTVITSAMFLTAMAANPLSIKLAHSVDVTLSWGEWFILAIIPGLLCLVIVPVLLARCLGISKEDNDVLRGLSRNSQELPPLSRHEAITALVFVGMVLGWGLGAALGLNPTIVGLSGVMVFILTGVLKWEDVTRNKEAWDTLIWFGGLITLAQAINDTGLTGYLGDFAAGSLSHLSVYTSFFLLYCLYFFSHYFFASSTAHVSAMFLPFLIVAIKIGFPPKLAVFLLATAGSLFGCLTHYGNGAAPLLYASGAVSVRTWWGLGLACSLIYIVLWLIIPVILFNNLWLASS